jgi:DNA-directed RNA polymerase subunit RPC12/RpoP
MRAISQDDELVDVCTRGLVGIRKKYSRKLLAREIDRWLSLLERSFVKPKKAYPPTFDELQDESVAAREEKSAALALGLLKEPRAVGPLLRCLQGPDESASRIDWRTALKALVSIGAMDVRILNVLGSHLAGKSGAELVPQENAVEALISLGVSPERIGEGIPGSTRAKLSRDTIARLGLVLCDSRVRLPYGCPTCRGTAIEVTILEGTNRARYECPTCGHTIVVWRRRKGEGYTSVSLVFNDGSSTVYWFGDCKQCDSVSTCTYFGEKDRWTCLSCGKQDSSSWRDGFGP